MSRLTKSLLALTIINTAAAAIFLCGLIDVSPMPGLYVTFPFAATFLGMFIISLTFQKEIAAFDAEQRANQNHAPLDYHPQPADSPPNHGYQTPLNA